MQSNTEKATVVLQYLFGAVDGERALRKVATRTHQCLAKSGKQPIFENNKLDLSSAPDTTKPLSIEVRACRILATATGRVGYQRYQREWDLAQHWLRLRSRGRQTWCCVRVRACGAWDDAARG
jgi:hypothetical protein